MKKNILFVLIALTLVAAIATLAVMMQPETVAGRIGERGRDTDEEAED